MFMAFHDVSVARPDLVAINHRAGVSGAASGELREYSRPMVALTDRLTQRRRVPAGLLDAAEDATDIDLEGLTAHPQVHSGSGYRVACERRDDLLFEGH